MFVVPASDGTLWATSYDPDSSCRLGRSGLDGRILERRRPISCGLEIVADTARGLVATIGDDPALLDPEDLSVLRRWDAPTVLHAVVGERVLLSTHGRFALVDPVTGDEVRLAPLTLSVRPDPGR